jgi:hypothetical protein
LESPLICAVADPGRFDAVETKIRRLREGLKAVEDSRLKDLPDVTELDPASGERVTRKRRRR